RATVGDRIRCVVEKLASGRHVTQLRVTATVDDRTVFCALGATGQPRPNGLTGQFDAMPRVTPAEESQPLRQPGRPELLAVAAHANLELREATFQSEVGSGRLALWARLTAGTDLTRAAIAYLADRVPMAITRGAGQMAPGASLDNCVRFAAVTPTEWVLLEIRGHVASGGYGHGSLIAWAPDGTLVATGSQSATMSHLRETHGATRELGEQS
ncbi:MAG: acyl-CoA thioesterase, partial [Acidimicrobiales bacterium]